MEDRRDKDPRGRDTGVGPGRGGTLVTNSRVLRSSLILTGDNSPPILDILPYFGPPVQTPETLV